MTGSSAPLASTQPIAASSKQAVARVTMAVALAQQEKTTSPRCWSWPQKGRSKGRFVHGSGNAAALPSLNDAPGRCHRGVRSGLRSFALLLERSAEKVLRLALSVGGEGGYNCARRLNVAVTLTLGVSRRDCLCSYTAATLGWIWLRCVASRRALRIALPVGDCVVHTHARTRDLAVIARQPAPVLAGCCSFI